MAINWFYIPDTRVRAGYLAERNDNLHFRISYDELFKKDWKVYSLFIEKIDKSDVEDMWRDVLGTS